MTRGRGDGVQKKRLITGLCVVAIFLGVLYFYDGSSFGSQVHNGATSLRKLGSSYLGGDDSSDSGKDESFSKLMEDGEDSIVPKSFPVCDDRHSELIPCLDRNLIYQMRLKLDLSFSLWSWQVHCLTCKYAQFFEEIVD